MTSGAWRSILCAWQRQREYADRLTHDLTPEQVFTAPPGGAVMNHPAWILCHLSVYSPVLVEMLAGGTPEDPLTHRYGKQSAPTLDLGDYPGWDQLRRDYFAGHDALAAALEAPRASVLESPPSIERFRGRWPRLSDVVVHLMLHHESVHLGQLSAWRRMCAFPSV